MIDIRFIRENSDLVRDALRKRGEDLSVVDDVLALDERRRRQLLALENHRAYQRVLSKEIGRLQTDKQKTHAVEEKVRK
jgi:seryl-tRNA synthetase